MIYMTVDNSEGTKTFTCSDGTEFVLPLDLDWKEYYSKRHDAMAHEMNYILAQLSEHTTVIYNVLKDWDYWTDSYGPKVRLSEAIEDVSDKDVYFFVFKPKGSIIEAYNAIRMFYDYFIVEYNLNGINSYDEFKSGEPLPRAVYGQFERIHFTKTNLVEDDVILMYANKVSLFGKSRTFLHLGTAKQQLWMYTNRINQLQGEKRILETVTNLTDDVGMDDWFKYENL